MSRILVAFFVIGAGCANAGIISSIIVTGTIAEQFTQWNTPVGDQIPDVWRQLPGPAYAAYASNLLSVNPGDSGTLSLRLDGFGGFAALGNTVYSLLVTHGPDSLGLSCNPAGATCTNAGFNGPVRGFLISNFSMSESDVDLVPAFANGQGPDSAKDFVVTFNYSLAPGSSIPEPATVLLAVAGLVMLKLRDVSTSRKAGIPVKGPAS